MKQQTGHQCQQMYTHKFTKMQVSTEKYCSCTERKPCSQENNGTVKPWQKDRSHTGGFRGVVVNFYLPECTSYLPLFPLPLPPLFTPPSHSHPFLPFPFPPFPIPPYTLSFPSPPLEEGPLNPARGLGSALSSPSGVWGRAPVEIEFGAFQS